MWQRRRLDRPATVDFTLNTPGETVYTNAAKVQLCPGCGLPGVAENYGGGVVFVHKRQVPGVPIEGCAEVEGDEAPELQVYDSDGELVYEGPLPDASKGN